MSFFPHWWGGTPPAGYSKLLADSREKGFKIVMCDSPMHRMAEQPGGNVPGCEMYSQVPAGNSTNVCPSYRGTYYTKELARVEAMVTKTRPDFVFWDIELWYDGAMDARAGRCSRCVAGQVASGKPMEAYLIDQATQSMKDLYDAVATSSVGFTMPVVACYDYHPYRNFYHSIVDFNQVYPKYVSLAQPSLYVAGNAQAVHDSIRGNYRLMKDKQIVPWLSTGCYGEIDPRKAEHQVLETLLNGASGLTYYWYGDFDTPLEFYYHAKALAQIAPYEDLIMDGEVLEPTGTNDKLCYSGIRKGNEMLLLVGNYQKDPASTVYTAPFTTVTQIKDLRSGKTIPAVNPIKLDLPKDEIRLLYITGK
ncbi:MAG: hypothetical protein NTY10_02280 [Candidatus Omnitrophica bacterium]|nr:hypothetical protein [Candidatus Omnitrophota bacterium]